jgi:hypothetical protein
MEADHFSVPANAANNCLADAEYDEAAIAASAPWAWSVVPARCSVRVNGGPQWVHMPTGAVWARQEPAGENGSLGWDNGCNPASSRHEVFRRPWY